MTPIPKPTSSPQKGVKMKPTQSQPKKKIGLTKALNDSISDTISSVIQGKITHQKPETKPASPKKVVNNDKPKPIKKLSTNAKEAVVISSSATSTPKNDNANVTRVHNSKAETSSPKRQQEKPVKAATTAVKQLKPNVSIDVKSQIKATNVVKRQNSPAKVVNSVTDKEKEPTKDSSKDRGGNKTDVPEKKDKPAPSKKVIVPNKTVKINKKVLADQKAKQKLVTKPKKVVETGVKKIIFVSKNTTLPKKLIKKITPKKKVPPTKEDISKSTSSTSSNTNRDKSPNELPIKEDQIKREPVEEASLTKLLKVKEENESDAERKSPKAKPISKVKSKPNALMIKRLLSNQSVNNKKQSKKMKLYNMWNGPKRHRVASLNALAKVHCLYENESRSVLLDQMIDGVKRENTGRIKSEDEAPCSSTRQLRTAPGLRGVGKHWEMHESCSSTSSSSSEEEEDEYEFKETNEKPCLRKIRRIRDIKPKEKVKIDSSDDAEPVAAPTKPKRPRKPKKKPDSPIMDLKDLIVPKRMASLNASAILAASYSVEKRSNRPPNSDSEDSTDSGDSYFKEPIPEDEQLEQIVKMEQQQAADERNKLIEVHAAPNSKKVAVILNQDTDVTITGVYVNSTRSTHHEGYCSIAGMQYRISATSHTQTAATAVTSEAILQSASSTEHGTTNGDPSASATTQGLPQPNKSYTPLDALSSMQPPSTSTSSSSANHQHAPPNSTTSTVPAPPSHPPHHLHNQHHHSNHNISSPPGGPPLPMHPGHLQHPQREYHHHHHHVGGPPPHPPGHYHPHPHQLVVAQYPPPPHQYYGPPHHGAIKGRYGLYHHHHHSSSSASDRGLYPPNSQSADNSAFSVPPGGVFGSATNSAGPASTISSSSSVVAASVGQPPPPTASQSSAGSGSESEIGSASGYVHGYYQPAGPLISLSHGHSQPTPLVKTQPADPPSSISPLPLPPHKIQPPSSTGDSSDNEVIITSVTTINNKDSTTNSVPSRLSPTSALTQHPPPSALPPPPSSNYRSPYHPQYHNQPPATYATYPPSSYSPYHSPYYSPYPPPNHHELCYPAPGGGYVTTGHKYPIGPQASVQAYRRYLTSTSGGYYVTTAPEMFGGQGPGPGPGPGGQGGGSREVVTTGVGSGASSNGSGSYQTASPHQHLPGSGSSSSQQGQQQPPPPTIIETYTPPPPPPALLDSYPPPPPPSHYYSGYGPAAPPPPACYAAHQHHSPNRGVPFLNATYPPCPCPMQSCPKNVHTGPLTGDCKRSTALQIAKATTLPPVALALPLEPASATGPPSPARGSAGMPPPPSPAGATYQTLPLNAEPPSTNTSAHSIHEMLPHLKNEQTSDNESNPTQSDSTQTTGSTVVPTQQEVDVKPEEKRRKARVGKAMVRNSIQQNINNGNGNIMLLMCNPSNDQATLISDVKREVESPEEVRPVEATKEKNCGIEELAVAEDLSTTKESPIIPNGQTNVEAFPLQVEPLVIQDVKTEKISEVPEVAKPQPTELLEPCQKTVAENVKVKNMKRKLSFNNNNVDEKKVVEEAPTPAKKSKQAPQVNINNNIPPNNGSYKDLIKKGYSTVKINNGKRKLISANGGKLQSKLVPSKFPKKRIPVKRKASIPLKDETNSKRVKLNPKPLATNNSKDNSHATKNNGVKENTFIDTSLIENKEPPTKPKAKNGRKNGQGDVKTNVDRTIESVVNQHANTPAVRTEKPPTRSRSKDDKTTNIVITNNNINNKRSAAVKATKSKVTSEAIVVPTAPPVISVSTVLPSVIPSVESFLKPTANPKSHLSVPSTSKATSPSATEAAATASDLLSCCEPSTSKGLGTSKQSVVRRRKGVPLCAGSVASGTRSLKASAALAASVIAAATIPKSGRRSLQQPRWSNGWTWEGEPYQREVFLNSDDAVVLRKCYPAMRHREGDIIEPRDCVLLKAGPRKNDLPFVAKVAALWENPEDGEMMMSLLWYYRPEHTEQGRTCADQPDEVFASRHKDSNSVACIEDKCYVLTFNEYCRYRKTLKRLEEGLADTSPCIPLSEPYVRDCRQPPKTVPTSSEMIFFCRRVYDFRQKRIVKNPS